MDVVYSRGSPVAESGACGKVPRFAGPSEARERYVVGQCPIKRLHRAWPSQLTRTGIRALDLVGLRVLVTHS